MLYLMFFFAVVGLTNIIVESELFSGFKMMLEKAGNGEWPALPKFSVKNFVLFVIKKIAYMVNCYQCSGFWAGFLIHLAIKHCDGVNVFMLNELISSTLYGFIGSFFSVVGYYVLQLLAKYSSK